MRRFAIGSSDVITLADESAFDRERTDPFSGAIFGTTLSDSGFRGLWGKRDTGSGNFNGYGCYAVGAGSSTATIHMDLRAAFGNQISVRTNAISITAIKSIVWTYSGSGAAGGVNIYVDGVNQSLTVNENSLVSSILHNQAMRIGQDSGTGGSDIAEWAFWDAQLTAAEAEILGDRFSPLFVRPQNLVSYLRLFGNDSPEPDIVGGHNGTLTGTTKVDHPAVLMPVSGS